jgi:hypothetical protein
MKKLFFSIIIALVASLAVNAQPLKFDTKNITNISPKVLINVATKAAYVHSSTTANTVGNSTILDVAAANNNPNAIILVTALDYVFCEKNVGVWYNTSTGKWAIFYEDQTPMPAGRRFNVVIDGGFVQTASAANITSNYTYIDNAASNNNPNAIIFVTQRWNGNASGYNNRAVGVWYDSKKGKWAVYNEDQSPMSAGLQFNVKITSLTNNSANPASIVNSITTNANFRLMETLGGETAIMILTHNYNPGGNGGTYFNFRPFLFFSTSPNPHWEIWYDTCGGDVPSTPPMGNAFNVISYK